MALLLPLQVLTTLQVNSLFYYNRSPVSRALFGGHRIKATLAGAAPPCDVCPPCLVVTCFRVLRLVPAIATACCLPTYVPVICWQWLHATCTAPGSSQALSCLLTSRRSPEHVNVHDAMRGAAGCNVRRRLFVRLQGR